MPCGLNWRASRKRNRMMAEKLLESPVLGTGVAEKKREPEGIGWFIFSGENRAE